MDRLRRRQVFADGGLPLAGEVLGLDAAVEEHTHDFLEVAVVLGGSVTHLSRSGEQALTAGAVTAVRPGRWHGYAGPEAAVVGNLYLGEELLHAELRWLLEVGPLGKFLLSGGTAAGRLDDAARERVRDRLAELAQVHPDGARQAPSRPSPSRSPSWPSWPGPAWTPVRAPPPSARRCATRCCCSAGSRSARGR